jgi:hypothetical protein
MSNRSLRLVLGLTMLLGVTTSMASAQGPVYRERWGYLHLEHRRAQVFDELQGRSDADVQKVAALLVEDDGGVPFVPVANALAYLRGVESDAAFRLRTTLGLFVLPEVVDPDGSQEACRAANFSVNLPFALPEAGAMTFRIVVRDADGAQVFEKLLTHKTAIADVRLAQAEVSVPCSELADGTYQVELQTRFDGSEPGEHDPTLRWPFHVLRGYQRRAELAMGKAVELRKDLEPLPRALLDGFASQVSRAYTGEAFAVRSDAVDDLLRLEQCLANFAADRAPLHGMRGVVPTGLPHGDITQSCLLRLAPDGKPQPTVVFATGCPTYDVTARRPAAPPVREGHWLLRELGDFGRAQGWNVAVFDSPGGGRPYPAALLSSIQALPEVLPSGGRKPLLVCDREAAAVVAMQLSRFAPHVSGVVLIGGGAMPIQVLDKLDGLPVRFVSLDGYPASKSIDRLMTFVESRSEQQNEGLDLGRLHERPTPWLYGPAWSRPELTTFATRLFHQR